MIHLRAGQLLVPLDKNHIVVGLIQLLGLHQQLLIELFAGTQAYLHDVNIFIWGIPGQADHIFRQAQNLYRLAHIQHI